MWLRGLAGLATSFSWALRGLGHAWTTERNFRIHLAAAYLVFVVASWLGFEPMEELVLALTVGAVIVAELFNTALEATVDAITAEYHPRARVAKDVAAAAVLVTSLVAVMVAVFLFGPSLPELGVVVRQRWAVHPAAVVLHLLVLSFLLVSSFIVPIVQEESQT